MVEQSFQCFLWRWRPEASHVTNWRFCLLENNSEELLFTLLERSLSSTANINPYATECQGVDSWILVTCLKNIPKADWITNHLVTWRLPGIERMKSNDSFLMIHDPGVFEAFFANFWWWCKFSNALQYLILIIYRY